jgi:hypothetical protein
MTQGSLFASTRTPPSKRGHVPRTSVLAARATNRDARIASVVLWLEQYTNCYGEPPTSAELADWQWGRQREYGRASMVFTLFVRRGLSDARRIGIVEHVLNGSRICAVTNRPCVTWRLRSR